MFAFQVDGNTTKVKLKRSLYITHGVPPFISYSSLQTLFNHLSEKSLTAAVVAAGAYLHHQKDGVENDESHNEILKWSRLDYSPQPVLETYSLFWHITF